MRLVFIIILLVMQIYAIDGVRKELQIANAMYASAHGFELPK